MAIKDLFQSCLRGKRQAPTFDFEKEEGGGLLKLVSKVLQTDMRKTVEWVKEFTNSSTHPIVSTKSFRL